MTRSRLGLWLSSPAWVGTDHVQGPASFCLRTQIWQTCISSSAWSGCTTDLALKKKKSLCLGLLRRVLQVESARVQLLVVASSFPFYHKQIPSGRALQILLQFPWGETRLRLPQKQPITLGELNNHLGLSFPPPPAGTVGLGEILSVWIALCQLGLGDTVSTSHSSYPSNVICFSSCVAGGCQSHPMF